MGGAPKTPKWDPIGFEPWPCLGDSARRSFGRQAASASCQGGAGEMWRPQGYRTVALGAQLFSDPGKNKVEPLFGLGPF